MLVPNPHCHPPVAQVYFPYLLMNKKRYAGLLWTKPEKWDKMDSKVGRTTWDEREGGRGERGGGREG